MVHQNFMLRVSGENEKFAKYSGMNVVMVVLLSQVIGGFIAGVGGTVQLLGLYRRFSWSMLLGYGWDAIIVTTLAVLVATKVGIFNIAVEGIMLTSALIGVILSLH